MLADTGVRAKT